MKIECIKDKLIEALGKAEKISTRGQGLPILSNVYLGANKGELTIHATNLDVGLEISLPAKVIEEGSLVLSGATLLSLVSQSKGDKNIILESKGGGVQVIVGKSSSIIKTQAQAEEFPSIPRTDGDVVVTINPSVLAKGLKSVAYAASTSQVKQELSSVYVYSDNDSLVFVSTDSFRLAEKTIKHKEAGDVPSVIIPSKNIPEILKVLEGISEDVQISFSKVQIAITSSHIYFVSRVIEGSFPDYRQIIPKTSVTEVVMLTKDIQDALRTSNVFSDKFNQIKISISPKNKLFSIKTENGAVGEYTTSIDASVTGEPLEVSFNSKYIYDSFQSIETDSVSFSFGGQNKPLIIKGVSDKTFLYLVMPMNK